MTNILSVSVLADVIHYFHVFIVLFIVFAPFFNVIGILLLHFTFGIGILLHWYTNNNICSLSILEGFLRGIDYKETLAHSFISPIYDFGRTIGINENIDLGICLTIVLVYISFTKLIASRFYEYKGHYTIKGFGELLSKNILFT